MLKMTQTGNHVMDPPGLLSLQGDPADTWRKWKGHFLLYLETLPEKDDEAKVTAFLENIGDEALDIYNTFHWECKEEKQLMSKILEKFDSFFYPHTSIVYERYLFNMRSQNEGECIDNYVAELRNIARHCEYGTQTEDLIRDRVISGIIDDNVRSNLLKEEDLYLDKVVEICRYGESVTAVKPRSMSVTDVLVEQTVSRRSFRLYTSMSSDNLFAQTSISGICKSEDEPREKTAEQVDGKTLCHNCNGQHRRYEQCPAYGIVCSLCKRKNHFAKTCKRQILRRCQFRVHSNQAMIDTLQED